MADRDRIAGKPLSPGSGGPLIVQKKRADRPHPSPSPAASLANLPYRRSSASLSTLFASTSNLPALKPVSPTETPPLAANSGSVFSPSASTVASPLSDVKSDDARTLISRSFVPHVAIHASIDTEEIAKEKGFDGGFLQLLRPFGELVSGKVTVRDSVGSSRAWEDFGVRFSGLGDGLADYSSADRRSMDLRSRPISGAPDVGSDLQSLPTSVLRRGGDLSSIEALVDRHLSHAEMVSDNYVTDYINYKDSAKQSSSSTSPFLMLYLRRLLSGLPLAPQETFSHPVACVIAISSRNPSPIETLRRLYSSTSQGEKRLPMWVNNEYLRYYVLVHDEDRDDITKSNALFDQMKRHFGLHCHLLRLRSVQCVPTDDDSIRIPSCEWISATEELAEIQKRELSEDLEDPTPCIFESDATGIRTFVREMVTQSIVPFMERCVSTWNDQVASRRRGLSGRFMSLSKRWAGFGAVSRASSGAGLVGSGGSNSNYDSLQGFYRADTPEATMRRLADYAFMLRDWKLAQSTYELLRLDFNNDKAWRYHAAANEMTAISTLLIPQTMTSKTRSETIDQMLDSAAYSYLTRCSNPYGALRSLALASELLKVRGGSAADDAAKWDIRVLESKILGPVGNTLFTERVAACFASRKGAGTVGWGARRRKGALWNVLAADAWLKLEKFVQAEKCLDEAERLYSRYNHMNITSKERENAEEGAAAGATKDRRGSNNLAFTAMATFISDLRLTLKANRTLASRAAGGGTNGTNMLDGGADNMLAEDGDADDDGQGLVEEESEKLDLRSHRKSLIGGGVGGVAPFASLDTGPLGGFSRTTTDQDESGEGGRRIDDHFE
ncbi:MAG: hypothetical protein M1819_001217 [Sarea resinae]|nr:MAG: hypothetical protein M1819_001217 [Sarea resinae]